MASSCGTIFALLPLLLAVMPLSFSASTTEETTDNSITNSTSTVTEDDRTTTVTSETSTFSTYPTDTNMTSSYSAETNFTTSYSTAENTFTTPYPAKNNYTFPTPDSPKNFTIVVIEPLDTGYMFALPKVLPVVDLAVKSINTVYSRVLYASVVHATGSCERNVVGVAAASISCQHNISVFVGPACSKAVETLSYMANDWNVPIITPIANTETVGDKDAFPRLTRINPIMQSSFVNTFFYMMRKYSWRHAVLFYISDVQPYSLLGETFTKAFKAQTFTWSSYDMSGNNESKRRQRDLLMDAASRARVFLVCLDINSLRELLVEAYRLGYTTSGDFAFIIILSLNVAPTAETTWKMGNTTDQVVKDSLAQALFMHIDDSVATLPADFVQQVRDNALMDYNYSFGFSQPSASLARYYDAVTMYATVVNETIFEGGDPYDGLALTRRLWNRTFTGLMGTVTVNEAGDRNSDVTITALNPGSLELQKYALFHSDKRELTFYNSKSFPWPLNEGLPPEDEPECGYTGIKCPNTANSNIVGGLSGFFAIAAVVGGAVALVMFRRWKKHSDQDLWWWKVEPADLAITDRKFFHSILSFTSKASTFGPGVEAESMGAKDGLLAVFKGQTIRLRSLPVKQPKFSRELLMEFKMVRDLNHSNLARIYGACFDDQIKVLLIEHCNKGSLQDLLGNTNVSLDAQFKFSLCTDVINGLCYLHDSPARCHGRLNSEVCLVDNRFSVKLADYALPSVYAQFLEDVGSQEYKNMCLWKAPEVLRGLDRKGSREADVYSFGIILCEVVTRDCPYSSEILYLTNEEILEKVRQLSEPPFRPAVEVPVRLAGMKMLMETCWAENPKERPSSQTVRSAIKKIALSLGETGNLLDNLMRRMELYANNLEKLVEDKTVELREEKKKSEELLYQILPRPVADRLKAGLRMEPESYECVTIYFSDIVGFTTISANSTPIQVVDLLNDVYSCFDSIVEEFDVYKVETIGDAYMVVSGLPQRNGNLHAAFIARMSLKLLKGIGEFKIRHMPDQKMRLRIGLHSGPVCAGVVGQKMPRYCLFGDTVNTASRMESHGEAMMIHMSSSVKAILDQFGTFMVTPRGQILIKGKGQMFTYWLIKENVPADK